LRNGSPPLRRGPECLRARSYESNWRGPRLLRSRPSCAGPARSRVRANFLRAKAFRAHERHRRYRVPGRVRKPQRSPSRLGCETGKPNLRALVNGWGYCDTHSRIAEAAWSEFKQDRRAAERVVVSIPRIGAGPNTIHFKVADASTVRGPIQVVYRYQTSSGERSLQQLLQPRDFQHSVATYHLDAPDLLRCNSLLIRY